MNSFASHGKTIRHTHGATLALGPGGLNMDTTRTGTEQRSNLHLDVYDSADPTAILTVSEKHHDMTGGLAQATIILNHEQVQAIVKAGQAFLKQYPHGIESARRLERTT